MKGDEVDKTKKNKKWNTSSEIVYKPNQKQQHGKLHRSGVDGEVNQTNRNQLQNKWDKYV